MPCHCGGVGAHTGAEQGRSCIKFKKNYKMQQIWVKSSSGGIFQHVSFGEKEMEAEIC